MRWLSSLKLEIAKYRLFRTYRDAELILKCKTIWNKILEEEQKTKTLIKDGNNAES
jgi:hypothetical protein